MEKVKVPKEVAAALDFILNDRGYSKERLLERHGNKNKLWEWRGEFAVLHNYSILEIAEMLIKGYEEELSFEEKKERIRKLFNEPHRENEFSALFDRGFDQGILATLEILDIEIEGVNK